VTQRLSLSTEAIPRNVSRPAGVGMPVSSRSWGRKVLAGVVNWGLVLALVSGVLGFRYVRDVRARAPLPVPPVQLGAVQRAVWESFPSYDDRVPVLLYHGIDDSGAAIATPPEAFAEQMLALHLGGFHTIDAATYAAHIEHGAPLPNKPVMITFDDGELSSYRGADAILQRYGFTATMFVVPAWIDRHPAWSLQWGELQAMQDSGRWDVQEHAGVGHTHVQIDAQGDEGEYYAYREFEPAANGDPGHLESFAAYRRRVSADVAWGYEALRRHIAGYDPVAFAVPYSNYGDRATNDERIAPFFLSMVHERLPLVFSGDYLASGPDRPNEQKARFSRNLGYRIQGVIDPNQLYCRLSAFVAHVPKQSEYACRPEAPAPVASRS
jgi:peptidoglycan/xylan/chitin deacetylase (PgdA/CDA1 family)